MAQKVKNLAAMQETGVWSLSQDFLKKGMATHSLFLPGKLPWMEEPGWMSSPWNHKESDMTEQLTIWKPHVEDDGATKIEGV